MFARLFLSQIGYVDADNHLNNIFNVSWNITKFSFWVGKSLLLNWKIFSIMSLIVRDAFTRFLFSQLGNVNIDYHFKNIFNVSWNITKFSFRVGKKLLFFTGNECKNIYTRFKRMHQKKNCSNKKNLSIRNSIYYFLFVYFFISFF
jgi:hypothetical protein